MVVDYELYKQLESYAQKHFESSKQVYLSRNQNLAKAYSDILRGKVAEFCAYFKLKELGYTLTPPDIAVYKAEHKSHDADLVVTAKKGEENFKPIYLHVKSVSLETFAKYGASFLVEKTDPLVKQPRAQHYYCVMVQESDYHYNFYKFLKSEEVEYLPPKLSRLTTKLAVYL